MHHGTTERSNTLALMPIARSLLREFWLPAVVATAWTLYSAYTAGPVWGLKEYVNVFGPSFFLVSWATGQVFRVKKQEDVEHKLSSLEANLNTLLDHVTPQHRADPTQQDDSARVIPLSRVVEFYDAVAPLYNNRNTGKYLATYVEIDAAIRSLLPSVEGISVCDVGGGTGTLLRWFLRNEVKWSNIDISRRSLNVFESEFASYINKTIRIRDVRAEKFLEPGEFFDVVVMSYLLSSLDRLPDFAQIRGAMREHSILVVADNHFDYVQKNPRYGFDGLNGQTLSIFPRPMFPDDLRSQVQAAGFVEVSYKLVLFDGAEPYSQVHVFKRAAVEGTPRPSL